MTISLFDQTGPASAIIVSMPDGGSLTITPRMVAVGIPQLGITADTILVKADDTTHTADEY